MDADKRHERIKELEEQMGEALRLRAEQQERFDTLYREYELLGSECLDQDCSCSSEGA